VDGQTVGEHAALELLESPVRRSIVDLLGNQPVADDGSPVGLTAARIGEHLGLHVTTARFHLDQLEAARLVESVFHRGGVGRPRKVYRIPHRSLPRAAPATEALQALTGLLTETWQRAEDGEPLTPEQAGRRWALREAADVAAPPRDQARTPGAWLGKVGSTVDLLRRWGYQPDLRTEDGGRTAELTLLDCPFLELAAQQPDVVCGIHRGLLRGALEAAGEPDADIALEPFVAPRTCRARLTTRADFT
jgi:predicted ArsR family transcriptional regulator